MGSRATLDIVRSDRELLEAWRTGDKDAGNELIDRHFDAVYRFFANKLPDAAEDLTQRTMLACVEGRDHFRGEASFRTYMFSIARNILYGALKRGRRNAAIDYGVTSLHDLAPSPSSVAALRDEEAVVVAALRQLSVDDQVVLELYFVQGLKGREVAEVIEQPEATARTRIRRALQRVRKLVARLSRHPRLRDSTLLRLQDWRAPLDPDDGEHEGGGGREAGPQ